MSCPLDGVPAPHTFYRVGREPDPWELPDWAFASGEPPTFDMRFDDADGKYRVLYAGSSPVVCFVEVIAQFRRDDELVAELGEIVSDAGDEGADIVPSGHLPSTWPRNRRLGTGTVEGEFANLGAASSLTFLRGHRELTQLRLSLGIPDLDAATIRESRPRALTQRVSRIVYDCLTDAGDPQFVGIHYLSKYGDELDCWAVFELADGSVPINRLNHESVMLTDQPLLDAMQLLNILQWNVEEGVASEP